MKKPSQKKQIRLFIHNILLSLLCSNETNVMITFKKIPGKALESETIQGSFCIGAIEQPNPGFNKMEQWKDIPGFEKRYQASSLGKIKSLKRYVNHYSGGKRIIKERILKHKPGSTGYCMVSLGGNQKNLLVHRLIGITFIPNPENKPCINHLNGIKKDNKLKNLNWCTYSENERHSYDVLGKKPHTTFFKGMIPPNRKPVAQFNKEGVLLNTFKSATEAARFFNGNQGRISTNCRGETKTCYKYVFKYI